MFLVHHFSFLLLLLLFIINIIILCVSPLLVPYSLVFFFSLLSYDCSQRAVTTALWCNFLVFSLKFGVWLASSSHVMLAEVVHSVADFANQVC